MPDIYTLGPGVVYSDETSYTVPISLAQRVISTNADGTRTLEDWGEVNVACSLGITALPAPVGDDGIGAEGLIVENVGGLNGHCVSAWDTRCAEVVGQMSPGDTCLHGTHLDAAKRAKVFCKENLLAMLVGDDLMFSLDNEDDPTNGRNKTASLMAFGSAFQMSEEGIKFADSSGTAWWELFSGAHSMVGPVAFKDPVSIGAAGLPVVLAPTLAAAITTLAAPFAAMTTVPGSAITTLLEGLVTALGAGAASTLLRTA